MSRWILPKFYLEVRDLLEMDKVGRQQQSIVGQCDGSNLQILNANPDPLFSQSPNTPAAASSKAAISHC